MDRLYFRKSQRITSDKDFTRVLGHRTVVRRGAMRLYAAPNDLDIPRFAVSISKSCGKAVERNRIKRLAREVFRKNQHSIEKGSDYILALSQAKTGARPQKCLKLNYKELEKTLMELFSAAAELLRKKRIEP